MQLTSKYLQAGVDAFASLPGVGRKSALNHVLHLLQQPGEVTDEFLEALREVKDKVRACDRCNNLSDGELCVICADERRDRRLICVVENVKQVMAIEETGHFRGTYHVLGGVISPMNGVEAADLSIDLLVSRVEELGEGVELVFAISPTIEGESTAFYIGRMLEDADVKLSAIARGVSYGNDLQYADYLTLSRSITARQPYVMNDR